MSEFLQAITDNAEAAFGLAVFLVIIAAMLVDVVEKWKRK